MGTMNTHFTQMRSRRSRPSATKTDTQCESDDFSQKSVTRRTKFQNSRTLSWVILLLAVPPIAAISYCSKCGELAELVAAPEGWSKGQVCGSCMTDDYFLPASLTPKEKQAKQKLLARIERMNAIIEASDDMPVVYALPGDKKALINEGKVVEKCVVNGWSGWIIKCSKFDGTEIKHGNLRHSVPTKDILFAGERRRLTNQPLIDRLLRESEL